MSNIRITGDGPKITATGNGSTVLVAVSTGQHDPGSFSGVHNDLSGRSTTAAHPGAAVSIDPAGFVGNLDGTITNAQLLAAAVDSLTGGGGGGVELGETSTTAYRGDRGKTAYDHSQVTTGNPHGTTASDVGADPAGTAAGLVDDLSGVSNQATARTNLGLGTAATAATGDFAAASHTHTGTQVSVDASGFNGNLTTSDDTVQEVAQKLDDLVIPAAGIADPGGANDDFLQRKSGAWTNRTVAQVRTDLAVGNAALFVTPPVNDYVGMPSPNVGAQGIANYVLGATGRGNIAPIWLPAATYDRIGVYVQSGGTATLRLGLYAASTSTGLPGTLVFDAGTISTASTGLIEATISQTLSAGWYWAAVVNDAHTSTFDLMGFGDSSAPTMFGSASQVSAGFRQRVALASGSWTTGGLTSSPPTLTWASAGVKVVLRRSA